MKGITLLVLASMAVCSQSAAVDLLQNLSSLASVSTLAGQLWESVSGDNCEKIIVPAGHGASLFTRKNCKGDRYDVPYGARNIPSDQSERHESAVVLADHALYLYDESYGSVSSKIKNFLRISNKNVKTILDLGKVAILAAPKDRNLYVNIKDGSSTDNNLSEDAEFAAVARGNTGKCPAVPAHVAANTYPEADCSLGGVAGIGGWDQPFQVPITNGEYELDDEDEGEEDAISCIVLRGGCRMILKDTALISNDGQIEISAPPGQDKIFNLGRSNDPKLKSLDKDVNVVEAFCDGETEINILKN
ncbi:hypothetical protein TCAL_14749 [Tigriopus californicus]|uniref:Uncharacterized protein n=1 Tax=Tigriopus californicus TaxID=6832 RepID=A0A553PGN8_TIGCA|nr:uncharacterized protein LOC131880093 [Tigriopus californicus]TRY76835.1 hypothetical protein TCAL_14749 [Tigriopus californicus]